MPSSRLAFSSNPTEATKADRSAEAVDQWAEQRIKAALTTKRTMNSSLKTKNLSMNEWYEAARGNASVDQI
jgi:hypothetical protein